MCNVNDFEEENDTKPTDPIERMKWRLSIEIKNCIAFEDEEMKKECEEELNALILLESDCNGFKEALNTEHDMLMNTLAEVNNLKQEIEERNHDLMDKHYSD
jgi:molecular chaperone GrpE (heat shock protein)